MTLLYVLIGLVVAYYFYKEYIKDNDKETTEDSMLIIGMAVVALCWPIYIFYKLTKKFLLEKEYKGDKKNESKEE